MMGKQRKVFSGTHLHEQKLTIEAGRFRRRSQNMATTSKSRPDVDEEPLSPAARLFHAPRFNCFIIAVMGCKTAIDPSVIIEGLKHTLIRHPRFSSKLVIDHKKRRKPRWIRTKVTVEGHVVVPDLDPEMESVDEFVEDYISNLTTIPLDLSKPLWELHLLNVRTSDAEALAVFRIHHSIGDGMSLMSLLHACTRKTSDPNVLPSLPVQKRADSSRSGGFWWLFLAFWMVLRLIVNTIVDVLVFLATIFFLKDTDNPLKAAPETKFNPRLFVHRTVSLDDVKLVKKAMNMTINDVLLGVTQAGLSLYLNRRYGEADKDGAAMQNVNSLPKTMRLRATILVNLRPTTGIQDLAEMMENESKARWGNWIGYILLPFNIGLQRDPLDYLHRAKTTIDRKKLSLEAILTFLSGKFILSTFGVEAAAATVRKVLCNTTMAFSNMVGPSEDISFYGHPMAYLAPSVYGHPHALTLHFQSYVNKMTICLAVDPVVIQDPHQLCNDLEESLKIIKNAVIEKGLIQNAN